MPTLPRFRVLPTPSAEDAKPTKPRPVMIDAELQSLAKIEAARAGRPLADLVASVFSPLLTPAGIEELLPMLPPDGARKPQGETAAVYLSPLLHAHLKIKATQHGRKLYELVETRLRQVLAQPPPQ